MSQFIKDTRRVRSGAGVSGSLVSAINILKNNEFKITYYEVISGTSGSLTVPTGATINSDEFGLSGNCILSKIDGSSKPTFESPKTAGGAVVTASLNTSTGAWVTSDTYTDSSVVLIYSIKIKAIDYSNLIYNNIIESEELDPIKTYTAPLNYSSLTETISIAQSTISTDGYLSSVDWNIFNNKQALLSGTGVVKSTAGVISYVNGTSSEFIKGDGSLDSNTYITSLLGTSNRITITGGNTVDIAATYIGQSTITTLGTVTTGSWNATSISTTYTDAKIKGSASVTNGILYQSAVDTATTSSNLTFNGTILTIANASGAANFKLGATTFGIEGGGSAYVAAAGNVFKILNAAISANIASFSGTTSYLNSTTGTFFGGTTSATAKVHISAGSASANNAPLKFTTGTNLTTAEAGVMEYNNTFHLTNSDATRRHIVLAPNTTKVTAGAPYTNDGYIVVNIGGTDFKIMTTA
jgi:hypothetical protein